MLRLFQKNTPSPGPVEFMIVGLGNPGKQYENTRHNAGFLAVDTIAQKHHTDIKRIKFKGLVGGMLPGREKGFALKALHLYELERPIGAGGHAVLQAAPREGAGHL